LLPHEILFSLFNLIYILPIAYIYIYGFTEGGVEKAINISTSMINEMMFFYIIMFVAFFSGSILTAKMLGVHKVKNIPYINISSFKLSIAQILIVSIIFIAQIIIKILLYKEGVYDSYAFDSGAMSNKYWTVSMGLSELCLALFVFAIICDKKIIGIIAFVMISLNLLHGTRIFTCISLIVVSYYYVFYKKRISGIKAVLIGLISFVLVVLIFLFIFIVRSNVDISISDLNMDIILSPVIYESAFNQISFVRMLQHLQLGNTYFAPHQLISDVIIYTIPQFTSIAKSSLMHSHDFGELSPLGGLSGYASAIIYFSDFYFIWYLFLGSALSFLMFKSRSSKYPILCRFFYVYIICDTLFRMQRDPYVIAMKMLVDNALFIFIFIVMSKKLKTDMSRNDYKSLKNW